MKQIALWGPEVPPKLRWLTAELRHLNAKYTGDFVVSFDGKGLLAVNPIRGPVYGRERLPGASKAFDAVAAARRLLAALRDLESA
jgi:hypothetical protein